MPRIQQTHQALGSEALLTLVVDAKEDAEPLFVARYFKETNNEDPNAIGNAIANEVTKVTAENITVFHNTR